MLLAGGVLWAASGAKACPIDQVVLEARKTDPSWGGYFTTEMNEPHWVGKTFDVTEYGERLEYRYVGTSGSRRVVGMVVARVEAPELVAYVATEKWVGSPFTADVSWRDGDIELADDIHWLTGGAPPLTTEAPWERTIFGEPMEIGGIVFSIIQGGPFQGMDLVFAGCRE